MGVGGGQTVEGPTEQERALADVSTQQWNDYVERFRPAEKALAKKAEFTAGEQAQVKGEVAADTAAAFKGLARSTKATGAQAGADVSSGKTKLSLAADAEGQAKAVGLGQAAAKTGGDIDSDLQNLKIAGFGRGQATAATANLSRGAVRASKLAMAEASAKFERNMANNDALASIAGAATQRFKLHRAGKPLDEVDFGLLSPDKERTFFPSSGPYKPGGDPSFLDHLGKLSQGPFGDVG